MVVCTIINFKPRYQNPNDSRVGTDQKYAIIVTGTRRTDPLIIFVELSKQDSNTYSNEQISADFTVYFQLNDHDWMYQDVSNESY